MVVYIFIYFLSFLEQRYLNLGSTGCTDGLDPLNDLGGSLNTLKLYAKFVNVLMEIGFIVFVRFSKGLRHFQAIHFTQLDPKLTSQLHMEMLS